LPGLFYSGAIGSTSQLHRLLGYLGVSSPFTCADTQANPTLAGASGSSLAGQHAFHPPFNRISNYREPGRINLNTIYAPEVFNALMNGFPGANWQSFWQSRQGSPAAAILTPPSPAYPTEFARPFRSPGGGQYGTGTLANLTPTAEINSTILRATSPTSPATPLFQYASSAQVDHTDRNPYFRYEGLERLGNLVTTRSNVYAVWITVGYFEVSPASQLPGYPWSLTAAQIQAIYPDGYTLGRELGIDTGEIERHRAFYIFDRTIPVGFQRGQDLNAEKAILLNRFIE
jgi:hypothetical protein